MNGFNFPALAPVPASSFSCGHGVFVLLMYSDNGFLSVFMFAAWDMVCNDRKATVTHSAKECFCQ